MSNLSLITKLANLPTFKSNEDLSLFVTKLIFATSPDIISFRTGKKNIITEVNNLSIPEFTEYDFLEEHSISTFICQILELIPYDQELNITANESSFTQEEKEEVLSIVFKEKTPLAKEIISLCFSLDHTAKEQANAILEKLDIYFPLLKGEDPFKVLYFYPLEKKNAFFFEKGVKEKDLKEKLLIYLLIKSLATNSDLERETRNFFI